MSTKLDMPIATSAIDSSGEILEIENVDISDFLEGRAWANWEHNNDHAEDIIGKFIYAKKILKASDCENKRQKMYWDKIKNPFIYGVVELMDDEHHPGAVAVAAMVRYFAKRKEPILVGASIEGQTLEREGSVLKRAVARKCAITLKPCNKQCWVDLMEDVPGSDTLKSEKDTSYTVEVDNALFEDSYTDIDPLIVLKKAVMDLNKTLTAGNYNVAPSMLTGGAALAVEDRGLRNRVKAVVRDWDRKRPLKEVIKAALPEVSDDYIDHFVDTAEKLSLKKGIKPPTRVSAHHSASSFANDSQKQLLEGLYLDSSKRFAPPSDEHGNSISSKSILKLRNDAGHNVLLKFPEKRGGDLNEYETAHHATAYHRLANDFFGMGKHVPITEQFYHPSQIDVHQDFHDRPFQAMHFIDEAKSVLSTDGDKAWQRARENGDMHKLFLMDLITGSSSDRHLHNMLVHPDGHLMHIDNDISFEHSSTQPSGYINNYEMGETEVAHDKLHVDAIKWLKSLNPKTLASQMSQQGLNKEAIFQSVRALQKAKQLADEGKSLSEIHEGIVADHKSGKVHNIEDAA